MNFEFLRPAAQEFEDAIDWYKTRSDRAAEGFRNAVAAAILRIASQPTAAGYLVGKRTRKIQLKPYSYGLIYFWQNDVIYVVAIAHQRRRPDYWKRRISKH